MNNRFLFFLVFSLVCLSRLPFLDAGSGNDQDGWRLATAARSIATTGDYIASRLPGFPVVELACALVWRSGTWAMNFLSALASALAAGMFALIAKQYGCRNSLLVSLTFAFIPIVYISSTITMDYLWAMMFVMMCWYNGLKGRPVIAGIFLGIATGCRITTAALAIPLALLFYEEQNWKSTVALIFKFWIATSVALIAVFLPVLHVYGTRFFTFFDQGLPPPMILARFITLDVWGVIGLLAFPVIVVSLVMNRKKNYDSSLPRTIPSEHVRVWIAVLMLIGIEFLAHPKEGAYLIPAIPFFLLILARSLKRIHFVLVCVLMILSSFVVSIDSADRPWSVGLSRSSVNIKFRGRAIAIDFLRGPIFHDYLLRKQRIEFVQKVIRAGSRLNESSAIIVGPWLSYIINMTPYALPESEFPDYSLRSGKVEYVPLLTPEFLDRFQKEGRRLYYLVAVDQHNKNVTGVDVRAAGATELEME